MRKITKYLLLAVLVVVFLSAVGCGNVDDNPDDESVLPRFTWEDIYGLFYSFFLLRVETDGKATAFRRVKKNNSITGDLRGCCFANRLCFCAQGGL